MTFTDPLDQEITVDGIHAAAARGFRQAGEAIPASLKQAQQADAPFKPRADSTARWGLRKLGHNRALAAFERAVQFQAQRQRNSIRRRAFLLRAAAGLGIAKFISRAEIGQMVLEAKEAANGQGFQVLTAADRAAMPRPTASWVIPGVLPDLDLSILGGRPKVGKSRVAACIAASILTGADFLGFGAPATTRPVLLVTDDAGDGDTADSLETLGVWHHPRLLWSRHLRLTEADIDGLLTTVRANPGAVVILDSLRSISRCLQYGENDPELAGYLYDLKAAVVEAGGTLLLIHHANKSTDGTGVEALSGHSAIAGAANTVLTLHYVTDSKGRQVKDVPQRRFAREGRSGQGWDLVIAGDPTGGTFHRVSTYSAWLEQAQQAAEEAEQEARRERKAERVTPEQRGALEALQAASGKWLTLRQVVEAMGLPWEGPQAPSAKRIRYGLDRLKELGECERVRAGKENTYSVPRVKHTPEPSEPSERPVMPSDLEDSGDLGTMGTIGTFSQGLGSQGMDPDSEGDLEAVSQGETDDVPDVPMVPKSSEQPKTRATTERSERSDGSTGSGQGVLELPAPPVIGSAWDAGTDGDDGDDPAWAPRGEVA